MELWHIDHGADQPSKKLKEGFSFDLHSCVFLVFIPFCCFWKMHCNVIFEKCLNKVIYHFCEEKPSTSELCDADVVHLHIYVATVADVVTWKHLYQKSYTGNHLWFKLPRRRMSG